MMGLEPTTFCMASRRSSQLSYIRAQRIIAAGVGRPERPPRLGCRARRRPSRASPSRGRIREPVEVERRLLIRMRLAERAHDLLLALDRIDGLEAQLRDALLVPALADPGRGRFSAEERP